MHELILKALDLLWSYRPNLLLRKIFPDDKIKDNIVISAGSESALCNLPSDAPASIQRIPFTFHNHLPFPLDLDYAEVKVSISRDTVVYSFLLTLNFQLPAHSGTEKTALIPLNENEASLIRKYPRDVVTLSMQGNLIMHAIGRKISIPLEVKFHSEILRPR